MHAVRIIVACILLAVAYGIVHDQITARICVEYFTVGHLRIFATEDPTLLALGWGVVATWWAGAILGIALALACRAGGWPKKTLTDVWPAIRNLLIIMALGALIGGLIGWLLARQGSIQLTGYVAWLTPPDKHEAFIAAAGAHSASYLLAFLGGAVIVARVVLSRRRAAKSAASKGA